VVTVSNLSRTVEGVLQLPVFRNVVFVWGPEAFWIYWKLYYVFWQV